MVDPSVEGDDDTSVSGEAEGISSREAEPTGEGLEDTQLALPFFHQVTQDHDLAHATQSDSTLSDIRRLADENRRGYSWENKNIVHTQDQEPFGRVVRQVVPKEHRAMVLQVAHKALGQLGSKKTQREISRLFTWPGICRDVKEFVGSCDKFLKYNKRGPWRVPLVNQPIFEIPFECISLDIVGPYRPSIGMRRQVLTSICHASGWTDCYPLTLFTTKEIVTCLFDLFSWQSLPREIVTDQGRQFVEKGLTAVCEYFGVQRIVTTPYHPQRNGKLEHSHSVLTNILSKICETQDDWVE